MSTSILHVNVERDQIERIRNSMESLYGLTCGIASELDEVNKSEKSPDEGLAALAGILHQLWEVTYGLSDDVADIREQNGLTKAGVEQDPPEGYKPKPLEGPSRNRFHRMGFVEGTPVLMVQSSW